MVGSLSGFPSYRLSSPRLEVSSEIEVEDEEEEEDDEDDEEDNGDVGDIRTTHSAMGTSRITVEKKIERRRKKKRDPLSTVKGRLPVPTMLLASLLRLLPSPRTKKKPTSSSRTTGMRTLREREWKMRVDRRRLLVLAAVHNPGPSTLYYKTVAVQ